MDGEGKFEHRFKAAVEKNFDQSADAYDRFEERHHLFETLTRRQLEMIEPSLPERILDVGCGTGISTLALHQTLAGRSPNIYAIDISERMLLRAKERCKSLRGIYFIRGDAENLSTYFNESFDAIFYTASIFLLPGFAESLRQASHLLLPGGVLSISYYSGLFNEKGEDAIPKAFPDQKYQYGAVPIRELVSCLESLPGMRTTRVDFRIEVSRDFLFDFLSIPAQSSGLFPKIPYLERIPKVRELCDLLAERVDPVFMGWELLIARKR
ncbi:class I SAM-dependent methyltransferase [Candidatus Deferrimicrobium sp.]|jgi:cyclopropane-fatty-acyl-phospholipid synthase|uniref:class I SAM-dependent methyltransferase n=1 Tax=Candidatus Deferrimicrobium sp. TaxID=3060586 RepID=UPI002ED86FA0